MSRRNPKLKCRRREHDADGNYIDNHTYDCAEADLREILDINQRIVGKGSDLASATGFKIQIRTPDGRIRAVPIDHISQQGLRHVDPFRCPIATCDGVFARRHTVKRHFSTAHADESAAGTQWYEHITVVNYPRGAERPNYHRRSKEEIGNLRAANGGKLLNKTSNVNEDTQMVGRYQHNGRHLLP